MKQSSKLFKIIGLLVVVGLLFAALPTGQVKAATIVNDESGLNAALASSETSIVLGADFPITATKLINRTINLDLNGKALTYATTAQSYAFDVVAGGALTVNNSTGTGSISVTGALGRGIKVSGGGSLIVNGGTVSGQQMGVGVYGNITGSGPAVHSVATINGGTIKGGPFPSYGVIVMGNNAELIVNGGLIEATGFGVAGNGTLIYAGTVIQINGGSIVSSGGTAMYLPQTGLVNITGGSITGPTGIEIRSGLLNVSGGTITGTGTYVATPGQYGSGSSPTGDAIFVNSDSGYAGDIDVTITAGTISSINSFALREFATLGVSESAIVITGGAFSGGPAAVSFQTVDPAILKLTGGEYNVDPAVFVFAPYGTYLVDPWWYIQSFPVALDDTYVTPHDKTLSIKAPGVLANDKVLNLDVKTATLVTNVSHGTLSLYGDGSFTYTPAPGFVGTDTFTYQLVTYPAPALAATWTDEALVTITVTPSPYIYYLPLIAK